MGRAALLLVVVALVSVCSGGASLAREDDPGFWPTRFLSPHFGFTVADGALLAFRSGRWKDITPPEIGRGAIEDVSFADPRLGLVAVSSGGRLRLFRTGNGGRSWLAVKQTFADSKRRRPAAVALFGERTAWVLTVHDDGDDLFRTDDGGRTWTRLANSDEFRRPPGIGLVSCLGRMEFRSRADGWIGRCGYAVSRTRDGGRHWREARILLPLAPTGRVLDQPRFFGREAVVAATIGEVATSYSIRATGVRFAVSADRGETWTIRATRPIDSCLVDRDTAHEDRVWPSGAADARTWWIVSGRQPTRVQITTDAGRHWRVVVAHGLPHVACMASSVSPVSAHEAWVVVPDNTGRNGLFRTRDGGRTWRRAQP